MRETSQIFMGGFCQPHALNALTGLSILLVRRDFLERPSLPSGDESGKGDTSATHANTTIRVREASRDFRQEIRLCQNLRSYGVHLSYGAKVASREARKKVRRRGGCIKRSGLEDQSTLQPRQG